MAPNHRHQWLSAVTIDVFGYNLKPQKRILNNVERKVKSFDCMSLASYFKDVPF